MNAISGRHRRPVQIALEIVGWATSKSASQIVYKVAPYMRIA
jgi:hypothetical protein